MKNYKNVITLVRNNRGCYILDTIKGCSYLKHNKDGCYSNCYAASIANRYGFDFSNVVKRYFINDKHRLSIVRRIKNIDSDFIRIGETGDPSEFWDHTINVCKLIKESGKKIVIVTKHFNKLSRKNIIDLKDLDICINTSISAMDTKKEIKHRLKQYNRLKKYCKSVLRVVTCDFNTNNKKGYDLSIVQEKLLNNDNVIDTIFRPNNKNQLVKEGVINTLKIKFLKSEVLASLYNKDNYFSYCYLCPDKCGINEIDTK